jgi:hypothetical protein
LLKNGDKPGKTPGTKPGKERMEAHHKLVKNGHKPGMKRHRN